MQFITPLRRLIAVGLLTASAFATAQPVANGNVKILVGFPAGGAPDAVARAFADQLRVSSGATVVVENRPGASGKIAIDALLAGPATGETIAVIPSSVLALVPQIVASAKYDSVRDFVTLGSVAEYGFGVAAGPASRATTIAAYKDWAKTHPKESSYGTPGLGTPQHFLGAQLEKSLAIDLTHIPYKGGAAAVTDVIGGTVPLLITTEQLLVPYETQGTLKALFITSNKRNPKMPQVPTAREVGLPQLEATDWFGVFARAGTSAASVSDWRAMVIKVISAPKYQDAMKGQGYTVPTGQPSDFPKLLATERSGWTERVRVSGFTAAD
jgi:tripartite-type tricarboxylate transporter receptor subunit TctC